MFEMVGIPGDFDLFFSRKREHPVVNTSSKTFNCYRRNSIPALLAAWKSRATTRTY